MVTFLYWNTGTATEGTDYSILMSTTTIEIEVVPSPSPSPSPPPSRPPPRPPPPLGGLNKRKRSDNTIEEIVGLIQIEADNTPDEGSDTFSVQLMSASFRGISLSISGTVLQYTIQDGMFV